jgi:hypothetical protein
MSFFTGNKFFFKHFFLVSNVKLWEIYIKTRKKEKKFYMGKKDCEMLIGYTFRVGYTYRADCKYSRLKTMKLKIVE